MTTNHFLYYIPGVQNSFEINEHALSVVGPSIEGCDLHVKNVVEGPGENGSGIIFAATPRHRAKDINTAEVIMGLSYCKDPQRQEWVEGKGFWVGMDKERQPSPDDLTREGRIAGYEYVDDSHRMWVVPVARTLDGGTYFDQRLGFDPKGNVIRSPLRRFESLCAFAQEHFEGLSAISLDTDFSVVFRDERIPRVAVEALGCNYHVGPYELTLLGALTIRGASKICGLLCDIPMLVASREAAEKKTDQTQDESSMNSGNTEK